MLSRAAICGSIPMTITTTTPAVFQTALGTNWLQLDDAIRRLHHPGATITATGAFRIRHGTNALTRLVARLAGFPAAGENIDMQLVITPTDHGEQWHRTFAGLLMASTLYPHAEGVVAERIGLQEVHLAVNVVDGALHYRSQRAALCLGRWRLPMPRWLTPRVSATEMTDGAGIAVTVEAHLPLFGLLIAYDGTINIAGDMS